VSREFLAGKFFRKFEGFNYRVYWPVMESVLGLRPLHYWMLGKQADIKEGEKVLELGSNYPLWLMYANRVGEAGMFVALEKDPWIQKISKKIVDKLPKRFRKDNHFLNTGDAHNIPFIDNTFDVIIASNLIAPFYHDEAFRVLRPGGRIVTSWAETVLHWDEIEIDAKKCKSAGFETPKYKLGTPGFLAPLSWNNVFQAFKPAG
jgi:SAM-dependent methyltransferase